MSGAADAAAVNWSGTPSVTCVTCGDVFDLNAIPKREREAVVLVEPSLPTVQMWQPRLAVLYGKHLALFKQTSATSVEPRGVVHLHQIRLDACASPARALDADRAAVAAIRIHGHEREVSHRHTSACLTFCSGTFSICIGSPAVRDAWLVALFRAVKRAPARFCLQCRVLIDLSLSMPPTHADNVRQVLKGEPYPLERFLVVAAGHYAIYRHAESFGDRMSLALAHLDPNGTRVQVKGPNRIEIARGDGAVDLFLVDDSTAWLAAFTEELEATAVGVGAKDGDSDGELDPREHRQSVVSFGLFEPGATAIVDLSPSLDDDGDAANVPRLLRPEGGDLALANTVLPAILVDVSSTALGIAINDDLLPLERLSLLGCALVLRTGQGGRARGAQPFVRLTTAKKLIASGVKLVAIDCPSLGAPDDESNELHTRLSQANISIALNLGGDIAQLPVDTKFALHVVPLSAAGAARAYAVVLNDEKCHLQAVKPAAEFATEPIEEKSARSNSKKKKNGTKKQV